MTIIVALKDKENKRIILGADKQATWGQLIYKSPSKLIELPITIEDEESIEKSKIHIGLCGYCFMKTFFQHGFKIPKMNKNENFIEYLYQKFFPNLRKALTDNSLVITKDGRLNTNSGMLFIFDNEVYCIGSNFCIDILDDEFFVDGSGWEVATGSLYTNLKYHQNMDKVEMVKQAIMSAGKNTIYCDTDVEIKTIEY